MVGLLVRCDRAVDYEGFSLWSDEFNVSWNPRGSTFLAVKKASASGRDFFTDNNVVLLGLYFIRHNTLAASAVCVLPSKSGRWANAGLLLVQRRRRWTNNDVSCLILWSRLTWLTLDMAACVTRGACVTLKQTKIYCRGACLSLVSLSVFILNPRKLFFSAISSHLHSRWDVNCYQGVNCCLWAWFAYRIKPEEHYILSFSTALILKNINNTNKSSPKFMRITVFFIDFVTRQI